MIGRVVPLLVLEGRAWDTGLENLWVHVDSEGAIDWVGVVDPTLRALPDDPYFRGTPGMRRRHSAQDGIVALPSEAALTTWVAHRCHRALAPLFAKLHEVSDGALSRAPRCGTSSAAPWSAPPPRCRCWPGSSEVDGMRRGQAVLDALVGFGAPVRGRSRARCRRRPC